MPPTTLIIPNFLIVDPLGWLDTLAVIVVPGAASAFGVFFLRQFFLSLPSELEEAATWTAPTPGRSSPGRAAAVQAGAGHPGGAGVPDQLERLPLADLRAVQPART